MGVTDASGGVADVVGTTMGGDECDGGTVAVGDIREVPVGATMGGGGVCFGLGELEGG